MKNKISVFVGISGNVYVLTATNSKKNTYQFEPVAVSHKDEYSILLDALMKTVSSFKDMDIDFYANNDCFAFEWEKEYLVNKEFSKTIKHYDTWNLISKIVKSNRLNLRIKGESSTLSAIGKKYRKESSLCK